MEKSLYLKTTNVMGILFPDGKLGTDKLLQNQHLDIYIDSLLKTELSYYDHNTFKNNDDLRSTYVPLVVKLIITNPARTGMWLIYEQEKQKVTIPGGHVSYDDVKFVREACMLNDKSEDTSGLLIAKEALSREIHEEFYGETVGLDTYYNTQESVYAVDEPSLHGTHPLQSMLTVVNSRLNVCHPIEPIEDLYYLYKGKNMDDLRSLTLYYVVDCELKRIGHHPKNMIWLDKELYKASNRRHHIEDRVHLLGNVLTPFPYETDIRFSHKYRPILDIIFNTPEIF